VVGFTFDVRWQAQTGRNSVQALKVLKLLGIDGNATLDSRRSHSRFFSIRSARRSFAGMTN
jgi:hypothetical protein